MLTLPSEPLPQTALMEPLPSIPPSFVSYGMSGSRRSPRKHHVTDRRPAPKPYNKTVTHARPRLSTNTTPVSDSVPSRLERSPLKQPPIQEQLDVTVATDNFSDTLTRPQISSRKIRPPPVTEAAFDRSYVCTKPALLETCSLLAPEEAPRGWVIGPIFQSFKSKMASFTEIVMSPFKSNGGGEDEPASSAKNTTDDEPGDDRRTNLAELTPENGNKSLESTEQPDDFGTKFKSDNVPLQTSNTELEMSITQSAWNSISTTTAAKIFDVAEEECASRSARTRKRPSKATPKVIDLGGDHAPTQHAGKDTDCNFLTNKDIQTKETDDFILKDEISENQADQTPTSPSVLEEASLKKVKRTLDLSDDTGKRKKTSAKMGEAGKGADFAQKRKPKHHNALSDAEQMSYAVTKAITRSNPKKSKVEQEDIAVAIPDESNTGSVMDFRTDDDTKGAKAKAKTTKRTKTKGDQSLASQTSLAAMPPDALSATLDTAHTGKAMVMSKKRKAKDNACTSSSEEVARVKGQRDEAEERGKTGRKLKKIKSAEVELKMGCDTTEKVYFEMTPSESEMWQISLSGDRAKDEKEVPKRRARRMDPHRRRCRAIHSAKSPTKRRTEDTLTRDDSEVFQKGVSTRLLRSVSCPEIPTLRLHEVPWTPHFHSPPRSRSQPPQQQHTAPHNLSSSSPSQAHHFHRSARRARRHTVCSVEVEREIAPLCLRKEVYPARRSPSPYDPQHLSPMRALSPGASLSALASCFLSSPLAFLSKKSDGNMSSPSRSMSPAVRLLSPNPAARSLSPAARSLSPAASAPSPPSLTSLLGTSLGQLPGFHLRTDTLLNASSDSSNSVLLVCAPDPPPAPEEDEDTSSSSPESEELRDETAHSDSELKLLKKDQGQRKVSSIKIRKALPKPQNNLTPMGLPKAIRVKKKEFSLEEIYTNKNFSKPPESRLETIFEVPLSRKNGSESWCGPRRVKRFMEFPELGEARRPRKPPVGATKANSANSRPRRGGCREDPALGSDPDSVLCAKLEQLGAWLQQNDS